MLNPTTDSRLGDDLLLQSALNEAIATLPANLQARARDVADATLAGHRRHGQDVTGPEPGAGGRIRHTIDAAFDRHACRHLAAGMVVVVRCWPDEQRRMGVIERFAFGASAPIHVRVDYPDGFTDSQGLEPINPAAYPLERVIPATSPVVLRREQAIAMLLSDSGADVRQALCQHFDIGDDDLAGAAATFE